MSRAKIRGLKVNLARVVGALRQQTEKLCDNPKVPDAIVDLQEAIEQFEDVVYGNTCKETRRLAFDTQILFDHMDTIDFRYVR